MLVKTGPVMAEHPTRTPVQSAARTAMAERRSAGTRKGRRPPSDRLKAGEFSAAGPGPQENGGQPSLASNAVDRTGPDRHARRRALKRGARGEFWASVALMLKGFRIVERRYRTRLGEIDLIARRGTLVLIVEVKVRATLAEAMAAIARQSERRIEAAADLWLARQPDHHRLSLRFDMVAVLPRRWPVHVPDIFAARR
jgi:putative endonuclease